MIQFRAMDKDHNKWVYTNIKDTHWYPKDDNGNLITKKNWIYAKAQYNRFVDGKTVTINSGLRDDLKKDIYQGDIVSYRAPDFGGEKIGIIQKVDACLYVESADGGGFFLIEEALKVHKPVHIIGNIFENENMVIALKI